MIVIFIFNFCRAGSSVCSYDKNGRKHFSKCFLQVAEETTMDAAVIVIQCFEVSSVLQLIEKYCSLTSADPNYSEYMDCVKTFKEGVNVDAVKEKVVECMENNNLK